MGTRHFTDAEKTQPLTRAENSHLHEGSSPGGPQMPAMLRPREMSAMRWLNRVKVATQWLDRPAPMASRETIPFERAGKTVSGITNGMVEGVPVHTETSQTDGHQEHPTLKNARHD